MIYTGIGSRKTPPSIIDLMTEVGIYFGKHGILLRSGGAVGADSAFEQGCDSVKGPKEIFFPSRTFSGRTADRPGIFYMGGPGVFTDLAYATGKRVWDSRDPLCKWEALKPFTKALMARNTLQILGADLSTPTKLVICWTQDGEASGGTGQALYLAEMINTNTKLDYVVPILNLQKESHRIAVTNIMRGSHPSGLINFAQDSLLKQYGKGPYKKAV